MSFFLELTTVKDVFRLNHFMAFLSDRPPQLAASFIQPLPKTELDAAALLPLTLCKSSEAWACLITLRSIIMRAIAIK